MDFLIIDEPAVADAATTAVALDATFRATEASLRAAKLERYEDALVDLAAASENPDQIDAVIDVVAGAKEEAQQEADAIQATADVAFENAELVQEVDIQETAARVVLNDLRSTESEYVYTRAQRDAEADENIRRSLDLKLVALEAAHEVLLEEVGAMQPGVLSGAAESLTIEGTALDTSELEAAAQIEEVQ